MQVADEPGGAVSPTKAATATTVLKATSSTAPRPELTTPLREEPSENRRVGPRRLNHVLFVRGLQLKKIDHPPS